MLTWLLFKYVNTCVHKAENIIFSNGIKMMLQFFLCIRLEAIFSLSIEIQTDMFSFYRSLLATGLAFDHFIRDRP